MFYLIIILSLTLGIFIGIVYERRKLTKLMKAESDSWERYVADINALWFYDMNELEEQLKKEKANYWIWN